MKKHTFFIVLLYLTTFSAQAFDLRGSLGAETRYFSHDQDWQSSIFIEPELYFENDSAEHSLTIKPFARYDAQDDERSHDDLREFFYQYAADSIELRAGINKIFWGVTESQHLVDVINQTDNLEGFDGEDKLGQPMIQLTWINDWGVIDAFALPYFRERQFAGQDGHFDIQFEFNHQMFNAAIQDARYESSKKEDHIDTALRYSHSLGDWDFGLSYFNGTERDPYWIIGEIDTNNQRISLTPYYVQMQQWGLDAQATLGAWLWKTEIISRDIQGQQLTAATAGIEYTFYGVTENGGDLGVLLELSKNDSPELAPSLAQNDVFVGGRFTWNDEQSSELLFGISQDLDKPQTYAAKIEASRRLGENYKLSLDSWFFNSTNPNDFIYNIRNEDFVQLSLEYYF